LLVSSAVLFALSSVFTGLSQTFSQFVLWRVAGGVAIGIASNVSPTYIAEVSPAVWRGRLVALNQLTIVIGILLAQIVNWLIADRVPSGATQAAIRASWNGQWAWRWMLIAVAVPSILFFFTSLLVPESPRWLLLKKRSTEARAVFARIGGPQYAQSAIDFFASAESERSQRDTTAHANTSRTFRRALLIGITLAVLQQWSGINVLFNYAQEIFEHAGYSANDVLFNIIITGVNNLVFTIVALGTVDRWGRRPLMLLGCAAIAISHLSLSVAYRTGATGLPVLVLTLLAIGCYAMSLAPITWVLISEVFPADSRGRGVAISVGALWIASFMLTFTFPMLQEKFGTSGVFLLYAAICAAGFLFVYRKVPETKNKTLEQIEKDLNA
jgi:sugar porter (SP) family MFS transporter